MGEGWRPGICTASDDNHCCGCNDCTYLICDDNVCIPCLDVDFSGADLYAYSSTCQPDAPGSPGILGDDQCVNLWWEGNNSNPGIPGTDSQGKVYTVAGPIHYESYLVPSSADPDGSEGVIFEDACVWRKCLYLDDNCYFDVLEVVLGRVGRVQDNPQWQYCQDRLSVVFYKSETGVYLRWTMTLRGFCCPDGPTPIQLLCKNLDSDDPVYGPDGLVGAMSGEHAAVCWMGIDPHADTHSKVRVTVSDSGVCSSGCDCHCVHCEPDITEGTEAGTGTEATRSSPACIVAEISGVVDDQCICDCPSLDGEYNLIGVNCTWGGTLCNPDRKTAICGFNGITISMFTVDDGGTVVLRAAVTTQSTNEEIFWERTWTLADWKVSGFYGCTDWSDLEIPFLSHSGQGTSGGKCDASSSTITISSTKGAICNEEDDCVITPCINRCNACCDLPVRIGIDTSPYAFSGACEGCANIPSTIYNIQSSSPCWWKFPSGSLELLDPLCPSGCRFPSGSPLPYVGWFTGIFLIVPFEGQFRWRVQIGLTSSESWGGGCTANNPGYFYANYTSIIFPMNDCKGPIASPLTLNLDAGGGFGMPSPWCSDNPMPTTIKIFDATL